MRFYRLVGAHISDQKGYQAYRESMVLLLKKLDGVFEYDYHTVATQMSAQGKHYNRLFVLSFPNEEVSKQYFADPQYQEIRKKYFDAAVADIEILATWQV